MLIYEDSSKKLRRYKYKMEQSELEKQKVDGMLPEQFAEFDKWLQFEKDPEKKVAWITFNRPERSNAMPLLIIDRINDYLKRAELDPEVKVVIFRGVGPHFGVGADATELGFQIGFKSGKTEEERKKPGQTQRLVDDRRTMGWDNPEMRTYRCVKATICQVQGYCYGLQFELAMASDIVICSEDARFAHPAFRYLGPMGNMNLWIETIGLRKVKEMMLTARPLSAEEALQCDLVNKVVPLDKLEETVMEYAQAISVMSMDGITIGKAIFEISLEARGVGLGSLMFAFGHTLLTNLKIQPDEWGFMKARRDKGLTAALAERDSMVAPPFRMSRKKRE